MKYYLRLLIMDISYFIAKRLALSEKSTVSSTIIKIAIAAVSVSVAVMLLSVFMIRGFQEGISDKVFGFWGHIDIFAGESTKEMSISPINDADKYIAKLKKLDNVKYTDIEGKQQKTKGGIKHVHKYILLPAILQEKNDYDGLLFKGVGDDYARQYIERHIISGELPHFGTGSAANAIVISKYTADRLNIKVGDKVIANFVKADNPVRKPLIVSGIYNTGLVEYDKKLAFVDIELTRKILGWNKNQVGGIEIFVDDISDLDIINEYIYVELLPSDVYSMTIKRKFGSIFEWLELLDINGRVILVLMLIVSIINMITSLLILILERTNMIGILKSLGADNWTLRKIFLYHATYIIIVGLLLGNILGVGIGLIQKHYGLIKLDEANYYLSQAPIYFDIPFMILINVGTLLLTVAVLIIPSYLVAKIDPVKTIMFR